MTTSQQALPTLITSYLVAHQAKDVNTAISHFTDDAVVVDEGNTFSGTDQISAWLGRSASEYTYTIDLTATERIDDEHYVATHHLEGNFPGGVVDLRFRFALHGGRIARLVIEP